MPIFFPPRAARQKKSLKIIFLHHGAGVEWAILSNKYPCFQIHKSSAAAAPPPRKTLSELLTTEEQLKRFLCESIAVVLLQTDHCNYTKQVTGQYIRFFFGSFPKELRALAALNYKKERLVYILGIGQVETLSGPSAAARTDISLSCDLTRHARNSFLLLPSFLSKLMIPLDNQV